MWLLFGIIAIIAAILNVVWTMKKKDAKWFRYISLSFTIVTLCAEYSQLSHWVANEDWSALLDVAPYMSEPLWALAICSILINGISLIQKHDK